MLDTGELTYRSIRRGLLDGSLRSSKELSQRQLAARLRADATSVRSALERLEAEQVLVRRPQSGTYVRRLDGAEFRRLYDLRALIEPYAASRAAQFITREQLTALARGCAGIAELCAELRRCGPDEWPVDYGPRNLRLEHAFHGTIMEAAQAPEAAHIVENLRILTHVGSHTEQWPRPALLAALARTVEEHQAICDAVRQGDSTLARTRMDQHLRSGFLGADWALDHADGQQGRCRRSRAGKSAVGRSRRGYTP